MNNRSYKVILDRKKTQETIQGDSLVLPYGQDSRLLRSARKIIGSTKDLFLSDVESDLLDVATAVFYADKYCIRGPRENWVRNIEISLSLRNVPRFKEIESDLRFCLSILGSDNISFTVREIEADEYSSPPRYNKRKKAPPPFTDIALLSGGQDSSAGAIDLTTSGRLPLYVRVNTGDRVKIKSTHRSIQAIQRSDSYVYSQPIVGLNSDEIGNYNSEKSQRLRSFYFLTLASLLGKSYGIDSVYINENGIMAIHLPLDLSRSSTFSTRTAYPLYLQNVEVVFRKWLGYPALKIKNIWALKTKAEVISDAVSKGGLRLMRESISCAHAAIVQRTDYITTKNRVIFEGGSSEDYHCGYCFPCVLRRISMHSADIEDVKYLSNPFRLINLVSSLDHDTVDEGASAVFSLIRFTTLFESLSDRDLLLKYPQVFECATCLDVETIELINLHRRFASEVRSYLADREPHLLFLLDARKSEEVSDKIRELAGINTLHSILDALKVSSNTHFDKKVYEGFNDVRMQIQIGLANDLATTDFFKNVAVEEIARTLPVEYEEGEVELNQNDGIEVREGFKRRCSSGKCYPLGPAPRSGT